QVPLDGARADVELRADLGIRVPLGRQARDLRLLRSEVSARLVGALACRLAGRLELAARALRERRGAHPIEEHVRRAQVFPGVATPVLAAQPLAVDEVRACKLRPHPRPADALDRLVVEQLGLLALAEQRPEPRLEASRPVVVAKPRPLDGQLAGALDPRPIVGPRGRIAQLGQRPAEGLERMVLAGALGRYQSVFVAAEAVEEYCARELGVDTGGSGGGGAAFGALDRLQCAGLVVLPCV